MPEHTTPQPSGSSGRLRVVVVDHHPMYRRGVRSVIDGEPDLQLVHDGESLPDNAVLDTADLLVLGTDRPDVERAVLCRRVRGRGHTRVVVVGRDPLAADVVEMVRAGADGYLLSGDAPEDLLAALRTVGRGRPHLSPALAATVMTQLQGLLRQEGPDRAVPTSVLALTPREREVLAAVAEGLSNRAVAERLYIAESTVKNHMRAVLHKLHLGSRVEAAMYAVNHGLVDRRTE